LLIKQVYFQLNLLPLYRARVASSFTDYLIKKSLTNQWMVCL